MSSNQIINQVTQQLKQVANDSRTPTGKPETAASIEQKEAINQIFELFRFNYHNQFLKAFPDHDTVIMAKRLWARLLVEYSPEVIMQAAEKTVKNSNWLPSVHHVIENCDISEILGMPSAHAAYVEACRAPSPKKTYQWSHPAIYYAGAATDWFFIANEVEAKVFPVFQRNYELLIQRIQNGEDLELAIPQALPEEISSPMTQEERKESIKVILCQLDQREGQ